jgi:putative spermidine/putrescine transport system permease protein
MNGAVEEQASPGSRAHWGVFLWPPLVLSLVLFVLPQASFIWMSFHKNLGFGQISEALTLDNYTLVLSDSFYLGSLGFTIYLSLIVTAVCLIVGFPTAYVLARARARWGSVFISILLVSSFITVVIKALGLIVILSQNGLINRVLLSSGLVKAPIQMLNNQTGVLIGLLHFTLPLLVLVLVGVLQTIPSRLEEAAAIHGASRFAVFRRVLLPLAAPGLIGGALMVFNMSMGAFTSAVILGGGRVLTLPVLIQRTIVLDVDYPLGSTLATLLLLVVFLINLLFVSLVVRMTWTRKIA